jgi:hypothetical protein
LFAVVLFLTGFYSMLVGSKIVFAVVTEKMKNILQQKAFVITVRLLGVVLVAFALLLLYKAVHYFM